MGGLFDSAPTPVVQSNEGTMMMAQAQMKQNELLMGQQAKADQAQRTAGGLAPVVAGKNLH